MPQLQLLPIVTTALGAARQLSAGHSLPSSPAQALGGARIVANHATGGVIEISYTFVDPNAAACMAQEMITAVVASYSRSQREVIILEMPTPATSLRTARPLFGGLAGTVGGIVIFIVWVVFRSMRRTGAV